MLLTEKIKQAIELINRQKDLPNRKDGSPYISHPYGVALLLSRVTEDEDVVIAGLLHDLIEDTGSEEKVVLDDIDSMFGRKVHDIVEAMTEDKDIEFEKRKELSRESFTTMSKEMLLVKSADILHNTGTLLYRLQKDPEPIVNNIKSHFQKALKNMENDIEALKNAWDENPFLEDLEYTLNNLSKINL